jgi:hypothetical protein
MPSHGRDSIGKSMETALEGPWCIAVEIGSLGPIVAFSMPTTRKVPRVLPFIERRVGIAELRFNLLKSLCSIWSAQLSWRYLWRDLYMWQFGMQL